jgi:hypothetical protein
MIFKPTKDRKKKTVQEPSKPVAVKVKPTEKITKPVSTKVKPPAIPGAVRTKTADSKKTNTRDARKNNVKP